MRGIHRGPVNSPHKWSVTRKMFPFDDVIMNMKKSGLCKSTWTPPVSKYPGRQPFLSARCGLISEPSGWCGLSSVLSARCGVSWVLSVRCGVRSVLSVWCGLRLVLSVRCGLRSVLSVRRGLGAPVRLLYGSNPWYLCHNSLGRHRLVGVPSASIIVGYN